MGVKFNQKCQAGNCRKKAEAIRTISTQDYSKGNLADRKDVTVRLCLIHYHHHDAGKTFPLDWRNIVLSKKESS